MMLRLHSLREDTTSEGPGHRFCVWVQGCTRQCPGCAARDTWDPAGGWELSVDELCARLARRMECQPALDGVTLLGGEPFEQAGPLAAFAAFAHTQGLSVFCFTGGTYEELAARSGPQVAALLAQVDVLADGPYVGAARDFSRPWLGSRNQRLLFLTSRCEREAFTRARNRVEVRLRRDGSIALNGMGAPLAALADTIHTATGMPDACPDQTATGSAAARHGEEPLA